MDYKHEINTSISVLIFSYNSEHDVRDCIKSAQLLTQSIILIDFESKDKTRDIAKELGAKIYTHPYITYVEPARNYGMQMTTSDWVMIIDADERITKELAEEIRTSIKLEGFSHYKMPRKEFFAKKVWLKNGGWWPNYISGRLIKKDQFVEWAENIHSAPKINGIQGILKHALLHYSKNDYEQIVNKTINFENIESDLLYNANKSVSTPTFFRKFLGELYRRMFKWKGYQDGTIGIIESIYQAFSKTVTYLYLYEKKNSRPL